MGSGTHSFCTAVNCMDGRFQLPVIRFLSARFEAAYVDMITEPGPNRILAEGARPERVAAIVERVGISVRKHRSRGVAVVGHEDCAGNPAAKDEQVEQLRRAVSLLRPHCPGLPVLALWAALDGTVEELTV